MPAPDQPARNLLHQVISPQVFARSCDDTIVAANEGGSAAGNTSVTGAVTPLGSGLPAILETVSRPPEGINRPFSMGGERRVLAEFTWIA
jgi:hypothetical protein